MPVRSRPATQWSRMPGSASAIAPTASASPPPGVALRPRASGSARPGGGALLLREDGDPEALVRRELEVRGLAQRAVRADLDAVPAVDAAHNVELVRLQVALAHHQRAGGAGLRARAARDAIGVAER